MAEERLDSQMQIDKKYYESIEQKLISEGHKGKYICIYSQKIIAIDPDKMKVSAEFAKILGDQLGKVDCYFQRIGVEEMTNDYPWESEDDPDSIYAYLEAGI